MKYYPLLCFFELDRSWGWCALTKISMIVIVVIFLQPKLIFLDQLGAGWSEPITNFCQNWSKQGVPLTVNSCRPKWQWRWDDDGLGVQASVLRWHCQGCQPLPGRPSPASAGFHPTTQPAHQPAHQLNQGLGVIGRLLSHQGLGFQVADFPFTKHFSAAKAIKVTQRQALLSYCHLVHSETSLWRSCCHLGRNTYDFYGKSANA